MEYFFKLHNRIYRNVSFVNTSPKISHSVQVVHNRIVNLWEFCVCSIIRYCHHAKFATDCRITILSAKTKWQIGVTQDAVFCHLYSVENLLHLDKSWFLKFRETTRYWTLIHAGEKIFTKSELFDTFSPVGCFADSIIPTRTSSNSIVMLFCVCLPKNHHCPVALNVKYIRFLQIHLNARKIDFKQSICVTSFYGWICHFIHRKLSNLIMYTGIENCNGGWFKSPLKLYINERPLFKVNNVINKLSLPWSQSNHNIDWGP